MDALPWLLQKWLGWLIPAENLTAYVPPLAECSLYRLNDCTKLKLLQHVKLTSVPAESSTYSGCSPGQRVRLNSPCPQFAECTRLAIERAAFLSCCVLMGSFVTHVDLTGSAGFTNRSESEYDPFGAGHSSTSVSAALGMAVGRDFKVSAIGACLLVLRTTVARLFLALSCAQQAFSGWQSAPITGIAGRSGLASGLPIMRHSIAFAGMCPRFQPG